MLVSQDWLSEYVEINMAHDELVDRLTMSGLNHEGSETVGDDRQIDLEVTSNRADCLGHIGVAREVAVLYQQPLSLPDPQPSATGRPIQDDFQVNIQCPDLCYRFTARLIRGVKVGPSPAWLQDRLRTANIGIVNNIVDISNYVMLECGQPLHTFDYDQLRGKQINVREPHAEEQLQAIDHRNYPLESGMCVIADGERAVSVAGVMGGVDSEVSEKTVNVLVEAAYFNPLAIRNAARKLNLHSPSSFRFERALDSAQIEWASRRCCQLILELAGGELAEGFIDEGQAPEPRQPISLRLAQLDRILGISIPVSDTKRILPALGFEIQQEDENTLMVLPPTWRLDVTREVDLIEEVGRIYGYDKVPDDVPVPMAASVRSDRERGIEKLRRALTAAGFDEAMTASLVPEKWSSAFSPWSDQEPLMSSQPMLGVLEKASQNIGQVNLLRRSLVPSLLEVFRINEYKKNVEVDLFELAGVYLPQTNGLPTEPWKLGLVSQRGYFDIKGVIESLVALLNPSVFVDAAPCDESVLDRDRSCQLLIDGKPLGWLGEVSDAGKKSFSFRRNATVAEIDVDTLLSVAIHVPQHAEISAFPAISRDFNLVVDESVRWSQLSQTIHAVQTDWIESVTYCETFRKPEKDGADKKRILLNVVLRSLSETLTGDQAESVCQEIVRQCSEQHGAKLLD